MSDLVQTQSPRKGREDDQGEERREEDKYVQLRTREPVPSRLNQVTPQLRLEEPILGRRAPHPAR